MKCWLLSACLLLAVPAAAQRPTAEVARPAPTFWPLEPRTGQVQFAGLVAHPAAPRLAQVEHLRAWLTQTVGTEWTELRVEADSGQYFQAQLPGVHAGVVLYFVVRLSQRPAGWYYRLATFTVRSPTGRPEVVHWLPLHRLLDDPDFRPDIEAFQRQLQRALPGL